MKKRLALTVLGAALVAPAHAAPKISAQSIIVNPVPSPVNVRVWTDRDSSGTGTPDYAPGDKIRLYTSVAQDAYVYLFNVDPSGQIDLILPNRYQGGGNFLKAGAVKVFPGAGDGFTFDIAAPYGVNKVLALASRTPLNIDDIASFKSQQGSFASVSVQGQGQLAQALSIVVTPVPDNAWDSATAYYRVAARPVPLAVPVRPVPVQPAPVQPAPGAGIPWGAGREWAAMDPRTNLRQVHDEYVARLRVEGYVLVQSTQTRSEIRSEFRSARGGKAELRVRHRGNRILVTIERDGTERD
ncbi:hypothetical protein HNQ07_004571 [Deinococcus metalli]|uniref:S-layer protein n=1 Tax=Deinococcus metalli TaxID=1141878 RepID=A0A7W8KIY9_9DEIO|nr:DUF4384 domain-containing protein [Deinococcus metalli]MBB5379061.1 hypothetical protein [Deinococcus metalli]GHF63954.1 S-layer protein [Deinococcus metalli]